MDATEYKRATTCPDAFADAEIEATVRCLRAGASPFAEVVAQAPRVPIPKPPLHHSGADTDFFRLDLPLAVVQELVGELLDAEAAAVSPEGNTTPEASHRASLVDRWGHYQRWLEARAV
jgi:hypothetical protein